MFLNIGLLVVIIIEFIIHWIERKDLYNRIMAKDLTEYQQKPIKVRTVNNMVQMRSDTTKRGGKP